MMTSKELRKLSDIAEKYIGEDCMVIAAAEHDIVYLDLPEDGISDEDLATLDEIGVFFAEGVSSWVFFT